MKKTTWLVLLNFGLFPFILIYGCKKDSSNPNHETTDTAKSVITIPTSRGEIIKHTYYSLSYIEANEQAEWVFYKLTSNMILGTQERTEDFRIDSLVSSGSSDLLDYKGSGYDRGHLCPAGDMTISYTAMSESFYLSNISPQNASFNRGIWETLESTIRNVAKDEKEIYVVTGPVFKNNKGTIGANKVTVPGFFYKVIYSPSNSKMIGFILPNEKGIKEVKDYAVTVDSIENLTNIDLFPQLSNELENKLEGKIDLSKWSLVPMSDPVPDPSDTSEVITDPNGCPATTNCGCSNKTKNYCSNDSCCQWIVGTGCKCK